MAAIVVFHVSKWRMIMMWVSTEERAPVKKDRFKTLSKNLCPIRARLFCRWSLRFITCGLMVNVCSTPNNKNRIVNWTLYGGVFLFHQTIGTRLDGKWGERKLFELTNNPSCVKWAVSKLCYIRFKTFSWKRKRWKFISFGLVGLFGVFIFRCVLCLPGS